MTQIKKLAFSGSAIAIAAILAMAVMAQTAYAAASTATPTAGVAGGTAAVLSIADTDLTAGDIVLFEIIGGTATGAFTSGGGQTLACADDASGGAVTTCDRNTAAGTVAVQISGTTAGTLLVRYSVFDGADGVGTGNGSSGVANVTINSPVAGVSLTRTPTSVPAAGGNSTITANVTNAAGQPGTGVVTFTTTLGNFTDGCSNATPTQVCSATINTPDGTEAGEVAGSAVVVLTGAGASGTANVTATTGGQSGSTTVTFAGNVATMTSSTQYDTNPDNGAFAVETEVAPGGAPNAATITNGFRIRVQLADAAGNPAGTAAPVATSTTAGVAIGACSAPTAGVSTCPVTAQPTAAGTVVNYSVVSGSVSTTGSWTVGGTTPATITVDAPGIEPVSVGQIEAEVKDAAGNPIGDGTTVTMVVTAGSLLQSTAKTSNGVATFTYVSPGQAQAVNATALVGSVTGSDSFNVGAGAGQGDGDDVGFEGTIAASGVSIVSFNGGTVADLAASGEAAGLTSIWVTVDGDFVGYIVGAPAFVNAQFNAAFADGVPAGTLAIVVR